MRETITMLFRFCVANASSGPCTLPISTSASMTAHWYGPPQYITIIISNHGHTQTRPIGPPCDMEYDHSLAIGHTHLEHEPDRPHCAWCIVFETRLQGAARSLLLCRSFTSLSLPLQETTSGALHIPHQPCRRRLTHTWGSWSRGAWDICGVQV